jgi:NAD(P)-dependent dehydrogenase (short-subunit alcohol dehydrogenase family)
MPLPSTTRAVVTGAGSGLGRAFCIELARRGARVVASDVNLAEARATVALLPGGNGHAVACDVSKRDQVEALAVEAERLIGGVDLIVNNAGVAVSGNIGDVPPADWEWIVGVNLWGVIHGCHTFVPRFRKQASGHVLNVASAAGLLSPPGMAPYNVTKAGVVAISETLRAELADTTIGVTVLCPTFFATNIHKSARGADDDFRVFADKLMRRSKLDAGDVARLALDGCDEKSLYVMPHADGRWMWRFKRMLPGPFAALAKRAIASQAKKLGLVYR